MARFFWIAVAAESPESMHYVLVHELIHKQMLNGAHTKTELTVPAGGSKRERGCSMTGIGHDTQ